MDIPVELKNMEFIKLVEGITFFLTLFLILSVLPLTMSMMTEKKTDAMPFNTFLFSFVNSYMASLYGSIIDNRIIITLNTIGVVLYGMATGIYTVNAPSKTSPAVKTLLALVVLIGIHHHGISLVSINDKKAFIGPISLVTAIVMLSSPLLDVGHFIKQKSCEGMAVPMIVLGFVCTCAWTYYGHLLKDPYIFIPNIPGFISSAVYFFLMAYYGFPTKEKQS